MKTATLFILSLVCILLACKKESFITSADARILITVDTLKYDTVFTQVGSVTQSFKIINENNQKLRLSSVKLMGGSSSAFKMNVDGLAAVAASNIEIAANDSVYVFVQVNVDPAAGNLPFIIRDSIQISYNGNDELVQLEAWGQNAHFLRNKAITADEVWTKDLPYVIQGYLYVDLNRTLTIQKGCRIYVHADAPLVIDGTLKVNGEKDTASRVYFQGDRLDEPYKDFPAAWPGIYFGPLSKDNVLNYATIKNSYQSIALEDPSVNANPKLVLNQCVIDNSYDAGIVSINSSITAQNCLISNCGRNIAISKGGVYQFTHCTVATYSSSYIMHKDPVLDISNAANNTTAALNALFRNCIFWGSGGLVENEVRVDKQGATPFDVIFDHALWKVNAIPANISPASNNYFNAPPGFDSIDVAKHYYNFRLRDTSQALNKGANSSVNIDIEGKSRPVGLPDLGSYERR